MGQVRKAQEKPKKKWMEIIRKNIKGFKESILLDKNEGQKDDPCDSAQFSSYFM